MSQAQQEAILRGKQETFGEFIYNSERGEFLGRTGTSWGKIFVFYCIYYGFLAAFFSICMLLFYQTLDTENLPKYQPGNEDSILKNPSMGYRPRPPADNIESSMITYSSDKPSTYENWVDSMGDLLSGKEDPDRNYMSEETPTNVKDCRENATLADGDVCDFKLDYLGNDCTKNNSFGYSSKSPCIILKLNRMIGWTPDVYKSEKDYPKEGIPKQLKAHIEEQTKNNGFPEMLWVTCDGENPMDSEMLGKDIEYLPTQGFPAYYFPYMNQDNYKSPLIAVRFKAIKPNVLIHISCKLYTKGVVYNRKENLGLVNMQFLINKRH